MSRGLGPTQKTIIRELAALGGAANTWTLQQIAEFQSGYISVISRALYRLRDRGAVKLVYRYDDSAGDGDDLTPTERERLAHAMVEHPRASTFWVLSDKTAASVQANEN